ISQQQFEAMAIKRGLSVDKKKDNWGQEKYKYDMIQIMYEGWVASREELKLVGYLSATASVCLMRGKQTIITPEDKGNCTPLYRLDK
ncbi:TPA: hypothetical protein PC598_004345, partial [Morganella morganii]|nr:hypothetical protein [Morganella morganii]